MAHVHLSLAASRELYEQVRSQVDMEAQQADGLLLHAAGELPDGQVRIVDVWADADALERANERMMATFAAAGVADVVTAGPQPEVSETFELLR